MWYYRCKRKIRFEEKGDKPDNSTERSNKIDLKVSIRCSNKAFIT